MLYEKTAIGGTTKPDIGVSQASFCVENAPDRSTAKGDDL
jgi:hypothetical protein